jgi:hypothetical protein
MYRTTTDGGDAIYYGAIDEPATVSLSVGKQSSVSPM